MSENILAVIADLKKRLAGEETRVAEAQKAVNKTKAAINLLCELGNMPPMFESMENAEQSAANTPTTGLAVVPDQFYNRPLSTCVRTALQLRRQAGLGPASVREIHAMLTAGGFSFDAKDEENALRGLAISITKNTALFARLPNGLIGLQDWYGGQKRKGRRGNSEVSNEPSSELPLDEPNSEVGSEHQLSQEEHIR